MNHTPCTKAELKEFLKYESGIYGQKSIRCPMLELGEGRIAYKYICVLRHAEYYRNSKKKLRALLWRIRLSKMQAKTGIKIPMNTCGKGLYLVHVGSILISPYAHIGENCSLHINTGIVAGGRTNKAPNIGNDVVIGIGAVVLGDITIPDGCAVGANALVNKTFEEQNIGIAGVPAKKISDNGKKAWANGCKNEV